MSQYITDIKIIELLLEKIKSEKDMSRREAFCRAMEIIAWQIPEDPYLSSLHLRKGDFCENQDTRLWTFITKCDLSTPCA